jgi:GNAT superfamily N-acetyltransferase
VRSWRDAYRSQLPREYLDSLSVPAREESWRRRIASAPADERPFWIAAVRDRIVGFINTGPSRDDDAQSGTAEIYSIYVDPDCWDKGIGTRLLQRAVHDLRRHGYELAALWCLGANSRARGFYERAGWKADGATKKETIGGVETEEVRYKLPLLADPLAANPARRVSTGRASI